MRVVRRGGNKWEMAEARPESEGSRALSQMADTLVGEGVHGGDV